MAAIPGAIDVARRLIGFDTINPPGNEESSGRYLGSLLETFGFTVAYHPMGPGRINLVASCGRSIAAGDRPGEHAEPICFTGHLDTVPLGSAPWSVDPLGAAIRDDKLYGRGSSDMKAGIAAMVVAALANLEAIASGSGLVLVFTAGEETGCDGARFLSSLDGALGKAGAIVVGEPTSNEPRIGHKGVLWLNAQSRGVAAHGSMPELGVNAAYRAARAVAKLEDFGFNIAPHPILGRPTLNVGRLESGSNINSVPDHANIAIDIRTLPGMDHRRLVEAMQSYLSQDLDALSRILDLAPVWTAPETPWLRQALRIAAERSGAEPRPAGAPYFTDASILKAAFGDAPTLVLGPGEQSMAHRTDEYCFVSRIEEAVDLYGALIRDWQANGTKYAAL